MYQPWQTDASMQHIMNLIDEREKKEAGNHSSHNVNRIPYGSNSTKWNIMSMNELHAQERPLHQASCTNRGRGEPEHSHGRGRSQSPARRLGRDLVPLANLGIQIASSISRKFRVDRARSGSSEDDSLEDRKRRRRSPSKNNFKTKRDRSVSRDKKRRRSRSRERSNSRSRDRRNNRSNSRDKRRDRSSSRDRKFRKRQGSNSREKKQVRSGSTDRDVYKKRLETPQPDATNDILSKFISIIKDVKEEPQSQKIAHNDVIPEFDPLDKANAIVTWLTRVDDIAMLFGWDEKETLQYAMPKLAGLAKCWYLARKDFVHSWAEWKKKLIEQFPCPNFGEMLQELDKRQSKSVETLENYFHDKYTLVKRCGIRGRQAVQCVLHGISDEPVRLFGAAAQFGEPEELLAYLQTAESIRTKIPTVPTPAAVVSAPLPSPASNNAGKPQCRFCLKYGHVEANCYKRYAPQTSKKGLRCTVCKQFGHDATVCRVSRKAGKNNAAVPPNTIIQKCFKCGKIGHKVATCQSASQETPVKGVQCFFCGEIGHFKNKCRKRNNEAAPDTASNGTDEAPSVIVTATEEPPPRDSRATTATKEPPPPGVEDH